eukprot:9029472-Ditylum_brightwellii.AAC.1
MAEDKPGKCESHRHINDNAKHGERDGGVTLNTDKNQIKEGKTTAKMMKEQGEQALESKGSHKTTVKFERKLPHRCQNFN